MPSSQLPADQHVHSEWSFDARDRGSMVGACARAVELGVPAVAFTEHVDASRWDAHDGFATRGFSRAPRRNFAPLDVEGYLACVEECRDRFPGLRVMSGIEAGEPHLYRSTVEAVLAAGSFERVLGSLHVVPVGDRLVESGEVVRGATAAGAREAMRTYLGEVAAMAASDAPFEVLAHVDLPRRHWPENAGPFCETEFEAEYREVFRALAGSGRVLEVNTRSPLASATLLGWWRDCGGRAVSFGSDAHEPWRVGQHFTEAMQVAEAAGFGRGRDAHDHWRR